MFLPNCKQKVLCKWFCRILRSHENGFISKDTMNMYVRKDIFIFPCNKQDFIYCFKMYLF